MPERSPARIAVYGPGAIGSTFAHRLARAGHTVTVVARGRRLEQLRRDGAVIDTAGDRGEVEVAEALDPEIEWDLVLVTVLAHQLEPVLPALRASRARRVMFMFNTLAPLASLREVVGAERFAFGFPAIMASFDPEGRLVAKIVRRGMVTTTTDAGWAERFGEAGIPAVVEADMESWLRTHAAFVAPFMSTAGLAHARGAGVTWAEASLGADALREGLDVVRALGSSLVPPAVARLGGMPRPALAAILWTATRIRSLRAAAAVGPGEPRALIDAMLEVARERGVPSEALRQIRP